MITSTLHVFPDEIRAHAGRKPCPATRPGTPRNPNSGRRYGT
jgi:hypothetical protein